MKKKIYTILDNEDKYISGLAKEIIEVFKTEANNENIEYSFTIKNDTGKVDDKVSNTYFIFDPKEDSLLHKVKKALFNKDLEKIQEGSKEEEELMEDVRKFLVKVCDTITKNYHKDLEETIRRVVLGNKVSKEKVPLGMIDVISIDIADFSSVPESTKYLLKIGKMPGSDINTDEVIKFVQDRQDKTGMDMDTIFSIEKQSQSPMFKNVVSIQKGRKFLNEITIYFFVDYSFDNNSEEKA